MKTSQKPTLVRCACEIEEMINRTTVPPLRSVVPDVGLYLCCKRVGRPTVFTLGTNKVMGKADQTIKDAK